MIRSSSSLTADSIEHLMRDAFEGLLCRIQERTARVGIIGLGYVGLPLARAFTGKGYAVLGFDVDESKVAQLRRGHSYIGHISDEIVAEMRDDGFEATGRFERLSEADAILICVPTPLTEAREPDLSYVTNSAEAIAAHLRPGQLVVLESTTYPGTTRQVVQPILEKRGLRVGEDFFLAFSPEREDPGNPKFSAPTIPKVVGGIEPRSLELAANLYGQTMVSVVRVSSPEVAEACKILENTYRAVNIALVNELKVLYQRMGIDVWEVIEAARTKPFGFQPFYPGPGLGGHCIPIDPFYLAWVARQIRLDDALHRTGRGDQYGHARLRRGAGRGRAERTRQADKRQPDHASGHGLQEGRGRCARIAGLGVDGTAAPERGRGPLQRSAHSAPAPDAASSGTGDGEPGADAGVPAEPGLRGDRDGPLGV